MIQELTTFEPYWDFINGINRDPSFAEPMLQTKEQIACNLTEALTSPDQVPLGVFSDGEMTGLFVFLVIEDEQYIEMDVGLSRSPAAYEEIVDWLQAHYPGYQVDFVFNPKNIVILDMLRRRGATVDPEQFKMVLTEDPPAVDTTGIEPLSPKYEAQYIALHATDLYWTGEKIVKALDTFRVFLAVDGGTVVGYIDMTKNNEENGPSDFLVREDFRRKGWGKKLLYKAIEENRPKDMTLIVDVGNDPAIALYRSMGFTDSSEPQSQVATLYLE